MTLTDSERQYMKLHEVLKLTHRAIERLETTDIAGHLLIERHSGVREVLDILYKIRELSEK